MRRNFILVVFAAFAAFGAIRNTCAAQPNRLSPVHTAVIFEGASTVLAQQAPPVARTQRPLKLNRKVTAYSLPPDLYRKARRLGQISFWGNLVAPLYSWIVLVLILGWRLGPKYSEWSARASSRKFLQAWIFAPPLLLTIALLTIPFDAAEQSVSRSFGLSIQSWPSWAWDWTKAEIVSIVVGTLLVWILYVVIRKSPRRWWFYFWLVSLPILVFLVSVNPVIFDPLFHKFVPLAQKDPVLVVSLENMVRRASQGIPAQRMFWMDAGAKTTELNAYVTGIGTSKRIVVWDTTIAKMDTPQIVYVAGHEMGHYVLEHIWKGLAVGAVGLFVLFYLLFRTIGWLLARFGTSWGIGALEDWASLPALLLLILIFSFIATPIGSAVSRHFEHQADQYGLEVTHGLTPDSSQVAAQSFQILGEVDLADPNPNPVDVFLFYSHPPIPDRVRFALSYNPWAHGRQPEWVK